MTATASIGSWFQRAIASSAENFAIPELNLTATGGPYAEANGIHMDVGDTDTVSYSWVGLPSGFTTTGIISAYAWELEEIGG